MHEEHSSLTITIKRQSYSLFAIAVLSIINALLILFTTTGIVYFSGFGVTEAIKCFVTNEKLLTTLIVLAALCITSFFTVLGVYARKKHSWAFIIGFFTYAIDSLFLILVQDWYSAILHFVIILFIYRGLNASQQYSKLKQPHQ